MATSNDSTVVLRIPQELKERLQQEAERLDISLSEVIRMKIMIAENALHREPVIRLGEQTYRLWEVLRPDLLTYDLVESQRSENVRQRVALFTEPEAGKDETMGRVSDVVQRAISASREIAIGLGCSEIDRVHLLLGLLDAGDSNAARIITHLAGDIAKIRKELEAAGRGTTTKRMAGRDMPLSRPAARVVKLMHMEAKRLGCRIADSIIFLLAILRNPDLSPTTLLKPFGIDYERVNNCAAPVRRDSGA